MTAAAVISSAALGTLTVSPSTLDKDILLKLVLNLCSPLQIKTVLSKSLSLELKDGTILVQRNAILRSLCGPALHHAVDLATNILGGHSTSRSCPVSAMALSSLTAWMSVASNYNPAQNDTMDQLESWLLQNAFLIPSSTPTLADMDMCLVLMQAQESNNANAADADAAITTNATTITPNVHRWMEATHARMKELDKNVPDLHLPATLTPMPVFFYGIEPFVPMTNSTAIKSVAKGTTKPSNEPQQQQPQQQQIDNKKSKKESKKPAEGAPKKVPPAPTPSSIDISCMDLRVGRIVKAWNHEDSEKLYCEEVDLGNLGVRKIASGLRAHYATPDLLEQRMVVVVCNLKSRNLAGFPSHGMVLCANNKDGLVEFITPPPTSVVGERIMFHGMEMMEPEGDSKVAKKKLFEQVAPDLKTDETGQVVWKGHVAMTSAGPVTSVNVTNGQVA